MALPSLVAEFTEITVGQKKRVHADGRNSRYPAKMALARSDYRIFRNHKVLFFGRAVAATFLTQKWVAECEYLRMKALSANVWRWIAERFKRREVAIAFGSCDEKEQQLRDLMLGALDGNSEAYRSLLCSLIPLIEKFFLEKADASANVLDALVQETLIAVHLHLQTYCPERSFLRWIYAIAAYKLSIRQEDRSRHFIDTICSAARQAIKLSGRHYRNVAAANQAIKM